MNYSVKNIKVKSNWFDKGKNKIKGIGYNGYSLYLNLFRFYVPRQENEYTFIVSVAALRKESGYTSKEIIELIKLMIKEKVIKTNITRWDRMYNDNGKLIDDKMFLIWACDEPKTTRTKIMKHGKEIEVDMPNTKDDTYVSVNLDLMEHYKKIGLNERSYLIYALIKKLSNNTERKCWMKINTMADNLGIGDNYVHKIIHELNRNYLLYSDYRKIDGYMIIDGKKKKKTRFEHYILGNIRSLEGFKSAFNDSINKNIKRWDKRLKSKKKDTVEDDMEIEDMIAVDLGYDVFEYLFED